MTDSDSSTAVDGAGTDGRTDTDTEADDAGGRRSIGRRGLLAGLASLGVLGTATGSARAASTPLEFGGNYTGDPGADWGLRLDPSNARFGMLGFSSATNGRGVVGRATASTGETIGVIGRSDSSSDGAAGLMGFNDALTGRTYGFKGRSDSTAGRGALGIATADSGDTIGLEGRADSPNGVAVSGTNTAPSGTTIGVLGQVNSPDGFGLYTPGIARIEGHVEASEVDTTGDDFVVTAGTQSMGDARNVLQGHASNAAYDGALGTIVAGGGFDDGTTDHSNAVVDHYAVVGGGRSNRAGSLDGDPSSSPYGTVGGGNANIVTGYGGTIAGGEENTGHDGYSTVGGGRNNTANAFAGTVAGGTGNTATAERATVGGGWGNDARAKYATIAGGGPVDPGNPTTTNNVVYDDYGTIGGGGNNTAGSADVYPANASFATVGGGVSNTASGLNATVGGGLSNVASEFNATVAGGRNNSAIAQRATVGGGVSNVADGQRATVGGGVSNVASGEAATVPGGYSNTADGAYSFAAGQGADANGHAGAFVFGDSTTTAIQAQNDNEVRSQMPLYAPAFNTTSARSAKTAFEPVDPQIVLAGVETLDVSTWRFDHRDDGRHMGPMAGEFHDAFGLGDDEETIATVDADGVALAAIQGLAERGDGRDGRIDELERTVEERDDRIDALETEIDALEAENEQLRDRLDAFEERLAAVESGGDDRE